MKLFSLSDRLKQMRQSRGLTLHDLARRAGTSVPTVSRYENGWSRFELYTLDKLATALGCRLRLELEPIDGNGVELKRRTVIRKLKRLFWDRPIQDSDLSRHPRWVIKRVLELGTLKDVLALRQLVGREAFLDYVAKTHFDSARTRVFWQKMLEQEGVPCTKKPFREEASSFWKN